MKPAPFLRIKSLSIEGLFAFASDKNAAIDLSDSQFASFIGKNNSGKSSIQKCIKLCVNPTDRPTDTANFHRDAKGRQATTGTVTITLALNDFSRIELLKFPFYEKLRDDLNVVKEKLQRGVTIHFSIGSNLTVDIPELKEVFPVEIDAVWNEGDSISDGRKKSLTVLVDGIRHLMRDNIKFTVFDRVQRLDCTRSDSLHESLRQLHSPPS